MQLRAVQEKEMQEKQRKRRGRVLLRFIMSDMTLLSVSKCLGVISLSIEDFHCYSASSIRYPIPTSVKIYCGCAGFFSSLRRIFAILTRRIRLFPSA